MTYAPSATRTDSMREGGSPAERAFDAQPPLTQTLSGNTDNPVEAVRIPVRHNLFARLGRWMRR